MRDTHGCAQPPAGPGMGEVACAGVYAQVVEPGTIRHRDQVRLLPTDGDG